MTGSNILINPSPNRKFGPVSLLVYLLWFGLIGFLVIRGCLGPGCTAQRLQSSDPCRAAALFEIDARKDTRASVSSVIKLTEMDNPCAFRALINLLDLPEGHNVDLEVRW